ncbi:ABC transporter substrate-binding protein [Verminephrobacter aporrectodeae subsp. tuberculatae]|uniref:ABC transporter substrate-binding protein n=1 Tax=Verminephrobacter aporrectodeae subsp. tuberculatae TaxID=1110392 RepID=A0ABT3KX88_9BURK|nr:ABC transporter substrate-binding protein [Verminephrobacter aporrectodeae]MCW5221603.1 ABC transporter substrate-binding protein [Verminephrobacter aporrectodeae subsp. tuberculatae]MCW5257918.1 ABC transporter substrate-binding protein [Verminephrobacter aporrectodeae subsp. tuberculatae]MCW5290893.1 ABC transporter substrate-binding protein [Verminephrobacter aporrectodeae subsp. tuberculatae]MCW5322948.1 ABC transporter substrate-binding protein [Verminephrobacter aporrectodeae subsp. tu
MRQRLSTFLLALSIACASAAPHAFETANGKRILVIGGQQAVSVMDPAQKYDLSIRTIQQATYDALLKYEGDPPELKPWLATSWSVSGDASEWTFRLDPRARFQNGDPVDAAAVKASFERTLKLNKGPAWMYADFLTPDNMTVVDAQTIRFKLTRPYAAFLGLVPWWYVVNVKEAMAHEVNGDSGQQWLTEHSAGSGPFRVKRVEPNALYELEPWNEYWKGWPQAERARLGGIIYRVMTENSSRRAALVRGEIDIASSLSPEDLDQLGSVKGVKIERKPGMGGFGLKFNTQGKYTADLNLRRALAYAFDYESLLKIYNGKARLMDSPFPPSVLGHIAVPDMPRRDMKKARAHLAKSQWPQGGIELEYVYVQGLEEERQMGLLLIDNLKPLGISIRMVPLTWPNMVARGSRVETSPDIFAAFTSAMSIDPESIAYQYHKGSWGQYYGTHFLNDPKLFALIDRARTLSSWPERQPLYEEIQRRIVAHQPEVFGMLRDRFTASRDYVQGLLDSPIRMAGEFDLYPLFIGR